MRLDKFLTELGCGTRSQVKAEIKKHAVTVNGAVVTKPDCPINPNTDLVCFGGQQLHYQEFEYYMLNKPAGCVSAVSDSRYPTVLSYLRSPRRDLFPVGRLDLDTEGLLLITNDGVLAHQLLSPKKHIPKTYYAKIDGMVTEQDVQVFQDGVDIGEKKPALPAKLEICNAGPISEILVTIYEGKYHQVKRMFDFVRKPVLYLKRMAMGPLQLDESLKPGEFRTLTDRELSALRSCKDNRNGSTE